MAKRGRKTSYDSYLKQFKAEVVKIINKGGSVKDAKPYSRAEFEMAHAELVEDRKRDVKKGKRKTVGNLTRTLVKEQVETYSERQAKVLAKYLRSQGNKSVTEYNVRYGIQRVDLSPVEKRRAELELSTPESSTKKKDIEKQISMEFFGS